MDVNKLNTVREYLASSFPGKVVEEQYDFDRGAQTFKVRDGKDSLLLKVGENFLEDNDSGQVNQFITDQAVAYQMSENKHLCIFVGNNAVSKLTRFS